MNQKDFLLNLVVSAFNSQYGRSYAPTDFDIRPVNNSQNSQCAFEFFTVDLADYLKMTIYCQFGKTTKLSPFRLFEQAGTQAGQLGNDVYVAEGILDNSFYAFAANAIHKACPTLKDLSNDVYILQDSDGAVLTLNDGSYIQLV